MLAKTSAKDNRYARSVDIADVILFLYNRNSDNNSTYHVFGG